MIGNNKMLTDNKDSNKELSDKLKELVLIKDAFSKETGKGKETAKATGLEQQTAVDNEAKHQLNKTNISDETNVSNETNIANEKNANSKNPPKPFAWKDALGFYKKERLNLDEDLMVTFDQKKADEDYNSADYKWWFFHTNLFRTPLYHHQRILFN